MDNTHYISPELLSIEKVQEIILQHISLALSNEARVNIQKCRDYLDKKMASHLKPIYGINTGFGSLCNVKISNENLQIFIHCSSARTNKTIIRIFQLCG